MKINTGAFALTTYNNDVFSDSFIKENQVQRASPDVIARQVESTRNQNKNAILFQNNEVQVPGNTQNGKRKPA
jgi:hypothetical protein